MNVDLRSIAEKLFQDAAAAAGWRASTGAWHHQHCQRR
jgi:hypothetical protein